MPVSIPSSSPRAPSAYKHRSILQNARYVEMLGTMPKIKRSPGTTWRGAITSEPRVFLVLIVCLLFVFVVVCGFCFFVFLFCFVLFCFCGGWGAFPNVWIGKKVI